jgi:hypothetical protein
LPKLKIMICLFHRNRKTLFWKWPKNHLFYPNLTIRCQKIENGSPYMFPKQHIGDRL